MSGIAIHEGWRPYRRYDLSRALCNVHHLREPAAVGAFWGRGWAVELAALLVDAKTAAEAAKARGAERLDDSALHSIRVRYGRLIAKGIAAYPEPETLCVAGHSGRPLPPAGFHRNHGVRFAAVPVIEMARRCRRRPGGCRRSGRAVG